MTRAAEVALTIDPKRVIRGWIVLIVIFGILGSLERIKGVPLGLFDLDGEGKPPAIFSAALLIGAGTMGLVIGTQTEERNRRAWWIVIGLFLLYMSLDELTTIHEHLENATGISWVKLYIPLVALGGIAWLVTARRLWPLGTTLWEWGPRCFALAPGPWVVATILEMAEAGSGGRVNGYSVMATIEELLEMVGDGLFLLGLLYAFRALVAGAPTYASSIRTTA